MDQLRGRFSGNIPGDAGLDRQLEDWIRSGIARDDRYTPEEVISGIGSGRFQLFRYPQGVVITQITSHRRLLVFLISGSELDNWKEEATEDLRAYAMSFGLEAVEAYCRPGLEKMLKGLGWEKEQVVLRLKGK